MHKMGKEMVTVFNKNERLIDHTTKSIAGLFTIFYLQFKMRHLQHIGI